MYNKFEKYTFKITTIYPKALWVKCMDQHLRDWHSGSAWHWQKRKCFTYLKHWSQDKMAAIFQTTFSNTFSWMKFVSLKFIPEGPINNIPALVQKMAWHWPGDKPLSEPKMLSLLTHIYASLGLIELMEAILLLSKISLENVLLFRHLIVK